MGREKQRRTNYSRMSENPNFNSSACVAHFILVGSSGWALKYSARQTPLIVGAFSFLIGHSVLGVVNCGHPTGSEVLQAIFGQTCLIAETAAVPIMATQLFMLADYPTSHAVIPIISASIPLLTQFFAGEHNQIIIDTIVGCNLIALMPYAYNRESPWAVGLIILSSLNQFVFRHISERYEVPKLDILAMSLSFFCVFAVNCICDAATA